MVDGVVISLVGMATVFVSLTAIMFLMMGVERVFRSDGVAVVDGVGVLEDLDTSETGARDDEQLSELAGGTARPESTAEVAAIALALAVHLRQRGKVLGACLRLDAVDYQIDVGAVGGEVVDVCVDGDMYRGSVGEDGLPPARPTGSKRMPGAAGPQRPGAWRSAYPPGLGGYWHRGGWSGGARCRQ